MRALAMAMGHVILKSSTSTSAAAYFDDYARRYTDLPLLVLLKEHTLADDAKRCVVPDRYVRASDFNGKLGQANNPRVEDRGLRRRGKVVLPNGSIGFRWGPEGRRRPGPVEPGTKRSAQRQRRQAALSVLEGGTRQRR